MSQENIHKSIKRSSLPNPYFIKNISLNDEKGNNKFGLNPNDKEIGSKFKKVKFSTDKLPLKTDFDFANLSPSKTNMKNSILKISKQNNTQQIDYCSKQLSQNNLSEESNKKNDNIIPLITNKKKK